MSDASVVNGNWRTLDFTMKIVQIALLPAVLWIGGTLIDLQTRGAAYEERLMAISDTLERIEKDIGKLETASADRYTGTQARSDLAAQRDRDAAQDAEINGVERRFETYLFPQGLGRQ